MSFILFAGLLVAYQTNHHKQNDKIIEQYFQRMERSS